jgi:ribonuclease Z
MSYLVVGPRYRGKFNAEKARELGVVGPDRSRLTRGETITITVKVGEETIERLIKPEDVIGKSEKASVS